MSKKKIVFIILLLFVGVIALRVYHVNAQVQTHIEKEYKKGDIVPFGTDFCNSSDEIIDGYTVQVIESEFLTKDAFNEKYNQEGKENDKLVEYYYVVRVIIENQDYEKGTECGIALDRMPLVGVNSWIMINRTMFDVLNPGMPGLGFSLQQGTQIELLLPYGIIPSSHGDYDYLEKHPPMLQITEYPQQKRIAIQ